MTVTYRTDEDGARAFTVTCDGGGCNHGLVREARFKSAQSDTVSAVMRSSGVGWKHERRNGVLVDICPACSAGAPQSSS